MVRVSWTDDPDRYKYFLVDYEPNWLQRLLGAKPRREIFVGGPTMFTEVTSGRRETFSMLPFELHAKLMSAFYKKNKTEDNERVRELKRC